MLTWKWMIRIWCLTLAFVDVVRSLFVCDKSLCNNEGVCTTRVLGGEIDCKCYLQYFIGAKCNSTSDACVTGYLGKCDVLGTFKCIPYFGGMDCECVDFEYTGRFCTKSHKKVSHFATRPAVYFPHAPRPGDVIPIFITLKQMQESLSLMVDLIGIQRRYPLDDFIYTDKINEMVQAPKNWPEELPQRYYLQTEHVFLHAGHFNVSITLRNVDEQEAMHTFEVYPAVPAGQCIPDVHFKAGPCSPYNYRSSRLSLHETYKMQLSIIPGCVHENNRVNVSFQFYTPENEQGGITEAVGDVFDSPLINFRKYPENKQYLLGVRVSEPLANGNGFDLCFFSFTFTDDVLVYFKGGILKRLEYTDVVNAEVVVQHPQAPNLDDIFTYQWSCTTLSFTAWYWDYLSGAMWREEDPCMWYFDVFENDTPQINSTFVMKNPGEYIIKLVVNLNQDFKDRYGITATRDYTTSLHLIVTNENMEPVLGIQCVTNCGDGTNETIYHVDWTLPVHLKGLCFVRCDDIRYRWILPMFWNPKYLILLGDMHEGLIMKPPIFPLRMDQLVVILISTRGGKALFALQLDKPKTLKMEDVSPTRPFGFEWTNSYTTGYKMCMKMVRDNEVFSFRYYHKLVNIHFGMGVLFAYGEHPCLENFILPGSMYMSELNIIAIAEDGNEHTYLYEVQISPPQERSRGASQQIRMITRMYYGRDTKPSVEFNINHKENQEVVQKFNFIIIEFAHMERSKKPREQSYILEMQSKIAIECLDGIQRLPIDTMSDLLQLSSVVFQYICINPKPLSTTIAIRIAKVYSMFLNMGIKLIEDKREFYEKHYRRLITFVFRPFMEALTTLLRPAKHASNLDLLDPISLEVKKGTSSELKFQFYEEKIDEHYADYQEMYANSTKVQETYKQLTDQTFKAMLAALDAMSLVTPNILYNEHALDGSIEFHRQSQVLRVAITVVRLAVVSTFVKGDHNIWHPNYLRLTWQTMSEEMDVQVCVQVLIFEESPFWWNSLGNSTLNTALLVHVRPERHIDEYVVSTFLVHFDTYKAKRQYQRGTANAVSRDTDTESTLSVHVCTIPPNIGNLITIEFKFDRTDSAVWIVTSTRKAPQYEEFTVDRVVRMGHKYRKIHTSIDLENRTKTVRLQLGIIPEGMRPVSYEVAFYGVQCATWQREETSDGEIWIPRTKSTTPNYDHTINCTFTSDPANDKLFLYSVMFQTVPNFIQGFMHVSFSAQMLSSYQIPATAVLILVLFFLMLMRAILTDKKDGEQKVVQYLVDNRRDENYMYVIVILTGYQSNAGTTSHIGVKLYGSNGNSKRHVLHGVFVKRNFQRRSADWFALTTDTSLGHIRAVECWIDHRGFSPSWYCEKLIVRDYTKQIEWVFMVEKWFSLVFDDQKVHRVLYQTIQPHPSCMEVLYQPKDFDIHHVWFGMFSREHCHAMSRAQKVCSAYSLMILTMFLIMFILGIAEISAEAVTDYGNVNIDIAIKSGFKALFLSMIVNYPFIYFYKNSPPNKKYNYYYEDISGIDPVGPIPIYRLPYEYRYVSLFFNLVTIGVCGFFTVYYGFTFGIRKSNMWLIAFLLTMAIDITVVESLHVIVRSFIWRIVLDKTDAYRICNEVIDLNVSNQIPLANPSAKLSNLKKDMCQPIPRVLRTILYDREMKFMQYRVVFSDIIRHSIYIVVLYAVFITNRDSNAYYSTKVMRDMMVDASYTDTIGLYSIISHESLMGFFNHTVIHVSQWQHPNWFVMTNMRLLGVIRLRQIRVSNHGCLPPSEFEGSLGSLCYLDLNAQNELKKNFNPGWKAYNRSLNLFPRFALPFVYQNERESNSFLTLGPNGILPGGGYIALLGRSKINTRFTLNLLMENNWFDEKTRVIFVEYTTYNVHANLFNVVKLIIEKTASGDYRNSEQIKTMHLVSRDRIGEIKQLILYCVLIIVVLMILAHQIQQLAALKVRHYCTDLWNIVDLVMVIMAAMCLYILYCKYMYTIYILNDLEISRQNMFISFAAAAFYEYMITTLAAMLVFLSIARMWKLLRFNDTFRVVEYTVVKASDALCSLTLALAIVILSFASLFHLLLGPFHYNCHTFYKTLIALFGLTFGMAKDLDTAELDHVGKIAYFFYGLFYIVMRIFVLNLFISVVITAYQMSRVKMDKEHTEYTLKDYINERIRNKVGRSEIVRHNILKHL